MNKVKRIYNKLIKRLPKKYHIPIRIFNKCYNMIKVEANLRKRTYKEQKLWYRKYLKKNDKNYISTKYWKSYNNNHRDRELDICGLGGNPIFLCIENLKIRKDYEIGFTILHEIAHQVFNTMNETKCDKFAIRWIKQLIKEGIFKNETNT